jgi:uncharacterized membrane protein
VCPAAKVRWKASTFRRAARIPGQLPQMDWKHGMDSFHKKRIIWLAAIEVLVALLCLAYALKNVEIFQERLKAASFLALCAALLLLAGLGYVLVIVKKTPLYRLMIFFGLSFGVLSCLIHTPGAVPDEPMHASNIYLLSNRLLLLPEKEAADQDNPVYRNVESFMRRADFASEQRILKSETITESYRDILKHTNWVYSADERELVSATLRDNSVTPIVYLPAIVGFTFARLLSLGFYPMLMIGRLCMLAFYVFAASWAIKKIPIGKTALFLTALLPMSLHLAASLSYDAVILALSMMTFSYIIYLAYGEIEKIRWKEILTMLALTVLLAPCKVGVYLPVLLLVFLIPRRKFSAKGRRMLFFLALLTAGLTSCALFNMQELSVASLSGLEQITSGETLYSARWALSHSGEVLQIILRTIHQDFFLRINEAIGQTLSWATVKISRWIILGFELCLLMTVFKLDGETIAAPKPAQRLLVLLPVLITIAMLMIGMLVWWTPRGSDVVLGIQGRYFIPLIPLILFAIPKISFKSRRKSGVTTFPDPGFSRYVAMASVLLGCASFLSQAAVILVR